MATWIEDRRVKIRRATRYDLDAIGTLLGTSIPTRFGRRAVADRRDDVYVAAEADGDLVGVLGLAYRRSLTRAGVVVDVDPLTGVRDSVVVGLLEFAIARARGRGAVRLVVAEPSGATATACEDRWRSERTRALSLRGVG
jgi:N-acetylglutamate synthase-like GNAT family acetyltransferase